MGIETAIAAVTLIGGVASAEKARSQQRSAARDERRARREQQAMQAAQAARERRQQVREERIRRGQILQASQTSGVAGSSGQIGATSSLSSQLGTNLGFNAGMIRGANRISAFGQSAADSMGRAQTWGQVSQFGMMGFQAVGGFNSLFSGMGNTQTAAPVEDRSIFRM